MSTGPKKLGDLLSSIIAKYGYAGTTARTELEETWDEVASEQVRKHTRLGSVRRGVLEILVDSPALLSRLESFEKQRLLEGIQSRVRHNQINSLRFRRL